MNGWMDDEERECTILLLRLLRPLPLAMRQFCHNAKGEPAAAILMPMQFPSTATLMGGRQRSRLEQLSGPAGFKYSRVQAGVLWIPVVHGMVQVDELRF